MSENCHKGYVVGCDMVGDGKKVWKVRIKDPCSKYDGQKFIVASVHESAELARGINVNFMLGSLDTGKEEKVLRAVNVRIENPELAGKIN